MAVALAPQRQLSLLVDVERVERPRKHVRQISTERYAELRDSDRLEPRQHDFLTALAAYTNRYQDPPTLAELASWAHRDGRLPRPDPNLYRPRASELAGSTIEYLQRRRCRVTGASAQPVRVRLKGSEAVR